MSMKVVLTRVTQDGLAYFYDATAQKSFAFTFDKIKGYKGETPKELGLHPGSQVLVDLDEKKAVDSVVLSP